jgi:hypothetical protein
MALDESSERHHEVDVLVPVGVPHAGTATTLKKNRAIGIYRCAARGRVDAFHEGAFGALEPLLRLSAAPADSDLFHQMASSEAGAAKIFVSFVTQERYKIN